MRLFCTILLILFLAFTALLFALSQRNLLQFAIVYTANHEVLENYDSYEISLDAHSSHRITNVMGDFQTRFVMDADCSANGDYLYFTAQGLHRINRDGSGLITLETRGHYRSLDLSPDDTTLVISAFAPEAYPDEQDIDLYTYDLLEQELILITKGIGNEEHPRWSPNGEKIVFSYGFIGTGFSGIALMNSDGTERKILLEDNFDNFEPNWSPDGHSIIFVSNRDGYYNLYTIGLDSSNLNQISFYNYNVSEPIWSPDGQFLSLMSDRTGNVEIFLLDIATGLTLQITDDTAMNYNDCWFPNN